jgi:hypothetical protein
MPGCGPPGPIFERMGGLRTASASKPAAKVAKLHKSRLSRPKKTSAPISVRRRVKYAG